MLGRNTHCQKERKEQDEGCSSGNGPGLSAKEPRL